jgi:ribonuclease P/MRP protein subunit POP5
MKIVKPALREKNRYVAFELLSDRKFSRDETVKAVWNSLLRFLGEIAVGAMGVWVMDWDMERQRGILKARHTSIKDLRLGLSMLSHVGDCKASVHVMGVSGTLRKAREKYLQERNGEKKV